MQHKHWYYAFWFAGFLIIGMPNAYAHDARLRTVVYDPLKVVPIWVQAGFAVHIALDENEHIVAAGTGLDSHCDDASAGWCVVATKGTHNVYVNVHKGAASTNLFVQTDRRNYSFDLISVSDSTPIHRSHLYRVTFNFPEQAAVLRDEKNKADAIERERMLLKQKLETQPQPKNWNYTMQALPGSDSITPTLMFDDGRFTYLKFPNNLEFPAIYMVADDGSESLVQRHVEHDMLVVHRVARRFVLRNGRAVIGLWNEEYNPGDNSKQSGTTVTDVSRESKLESSRELDAADIQREPITQTGQPVARIPSVTPEMIDSQLRSTSLNKFQRLLQEYETR
ncbi:TrbG/VirB9 family P-type conjugative transfer protein [Burkholderia territorii]|uniref:TrbG/VirB9 family P-type conjugative transfer protein n=1 Tax=Burkholderia territorii TaxID=1503055 RepID=UPI0009C041F4|nr:TrbG/VirB9 family P-type conjugative transfer protein [Burkholderia territorii]